MKIAKKLQAELDASGKNYRLERGGQHIKIYVENFFCGICPANGKSNTNRAELNVRAQIRRAVKQLA